MVAVLCADAGFAALVASFAYVVAGAAIYGAGYEGARVRNPNNDFFLQRLWEQYFVAYFGRCLLMSAIVLALCMCQLFGWRYTRLPTRRRFLASVACGLLLTCVGMWRCSQGVVLDLR
jgi:hypothetical protein